MKQRIRNLKIIKLIFLLFVFFFSSCIKTFDDRYPYFYEVQNTTNKVIKVVYKGLTSAWIGAPGNTFDSVICIAPAQKKVLISRIIGQYNGSSVMRNPETDSLLSCINYLEITVKDTLSGNRNYLATKYWVYYQIDDNKAGLLLTIYNEDFQ